MMSVATSRAIDRIEAGLLYDFTKATVALFYLLQGMEVASCVFGKRPDDQPKPQCSMEGPHLTHLKTFPAVSTTGPDMLGPNGEAVQLAFKGWVADIYGKWEKSRTKTRELLGDEGVRPEVDCMGDFRHIRHDLIHSGSATEEHSGKCKVLRWFKPGQRMILTTDHVFDLLNQMSLITPPIQLSGALGGWIAAWMLVPDAIKPTSLMQEGVHIVSFRFDVDNDGPGGAQRYMLSIVFSDGVFGEGDVGVPVSPDQYLQGSISDDGHLAFDGGHILNANEIYDMCYRYLSGDRRDGPGISGPDARYMKENDS